MGRNVAEQRTSLHGARDILVSPHPAITVAVYVHVHEVAPTFSQRFPEAANIFDNLHMLHDNIDDVLISPGPVPDVGSKTAAYLPTA